MSRRVSARCPYCKSPGRARDSEEVSILHRDIYFDCTNNGCGHRWKAQMSFVHSVSTPVGVEIKYPVTPKRYRRARRDGEPPPTPVPA